MDIPLPKPEELSHGYLLIGSRDVLEPAVHAYAEKLLGGPLTVSPDAYVFSGGSLYIDDVRDIVTRASRTASKGGRKVFILTLSQATTEAQNALLKFLEEPTAATHIFIITPTLETLLPTLRSRLIVHRVASDEPVSVEALAFLQGGQVERQEVIAPLIETKDKEAAARLLQGIETALHRALSNDRSLSGALSDIESARQYLGDRSASVKMLLEYVATITPHMSL